ncbi:MAG: hypothetical protein KDD40_00730 [Bdellovibrionales bacterium]|nr:hypothetical protein [Bdellovibrionales bacterium]
MKTLVFLFLILFSMHPSFALEKEFDLNTMFQRVTGFQLRSMDRNELGLNNLTENTNFFDLFQTLSEHPGFINNRLATFVSKLSTEDADPFQEEDDYQAAILLAIMSEIDFRDIFSKKFHIRLKESVQTIRPGKEYYILGRNYQSLNELIENYELVFDSEQPASYNEGFYDGLFTTSGFGKRFIKGGTNRRPVRAIFDIFLCSKIETYKDSSLDPFYIGPDIDRNPGDKPHSFDENCSGCHAPIDGNRGSMAFIDYDEDSRTVIRLDEVAEKYNRNPKEFGGFLTVSDHWENVLTTPAHQARFEWRGKTSGNGVRSFAKMIVDSGQFQRCMVSRLAEEFCELDTEDLETSENRKLLGNIANDFRKNQYNMKKTIATLVSSSICK